MRTCGECKRFRWLWPNKRNDRAVCVADLPEWAARILRVSQNSIYETDDSTDCPCFEAGEESGDDAR